MAVLTPTELTAMRQACFESFSGVVNYSKPQINAAEQAIENTMIVRSLTAGDAGQTIAQLLSAQIDVATAPFVFTNPQKKALFAQWCYLKFTKDK